MGALWCPLGLLHFLVCATRMLQWASNKRPKQVKIHGLGCFLGTRLGRPIWIIPTKNTFPCSAALVLDLREAFSCSVALVLGFLMFPWVVQHGPVRASEISINLIDFCIFCNKAKKDVVPEADAESTPMQRGDHTEHRKASFL